MSRRTTARVLSVVLVAVVALVAVAVTRSVRSGGKGSVATSPLLERGTWRELPTPPLSPRADPRAVWTGREVVFLGGASKPCPPLVNCDEPFTPARAAAYYGEKSDGAAYDLASGTWRRLAPSPISGSFNSLVYAGGHVLADDGRGNVWDYDVKGDAWARFRPRWDARAGVSAAAGRICGTSSYGRPVAHVVCYRPRTSSWSRYPVDRLRPRLDGYAVATTAGPVLVGSYASRTPYHHLPSTMVADRWTGQAWRRLPLTPQLDRQVTWTGRRLVDPVQGTRYHGGADAWPHRYPEGGVLDPATGRWTTLPASWQAAEVAYGGPTPGWDVDTPYAGSGPRFVVRGEVYDDDTGSAWLLPRPDGSPQYFASGVWAGDQFVVLGGANFDGQRQTGVSRRAWIYTP